MKSKELKNKVAKNPMSKPALKRIAEVDKTINELLKFIVFQPTDINKVKLILSNFYLSAQLDGYFMSKKIK
jgi:hypothetical protein